MGGNRIMTTSINIERWYEKQREVDTLIEKKMVNLKLTDYLSLEHRTFAFQCELMELANEIGFFKDWKHSHKIDLEDTLEELADNIAFVMSVGATKHYDKVVKEIEPFPLWEDYSYLELFKSLQQNDLSSVGKFQLALSILLGIGLKLNVEVGLPLIERAYFAKANKNIERQKEGY